MPYDHRHHASAQLSRLRPNGRASIGYRAGLGLSQSCCASADSAAASSAVSSEATQPPPKHSTSIIIVSALVVLMCTSTTDVRWMALARLPTMIYFLPMRRRLVLVGYDGADGLDLFGPAEVFAGTTRRLGAPAYDVIVAAIGGGSIALSSGAAVLVRDLAAIRPQATDTVL